MNYKQGFYYYYNKNKNKIITFNYLSNKRHKIKSLNFIKNNHNIDIINKFLKKYDLILYNNHTSNNYIDYIIKDL